MTQDTFSFAQWLFLLAIFMLCFLSMISLLPQTYGWQVEQMHYTSSIVLTPILRYYRKPTHYLHKYMLIQISGYPSSSAPIRWHLICPHQLSWQQTLCQIWISQGYTAFLNTKWWHVYLYHNSTPRPPCLLITSMLSIMINPSLHWQCSIRWDRFHCTLIKICPITLLEITLTNNGKGSGVMFEIQMTYNPLDYNLTNNLVWLTMDWDPIFNSC